MTQCGDHQVTIHILVTVTVTVIEINGFTIVTAPETMTKTVVGVGVIRTTVIDMIASEIGIGMPLRVTGIVGITGRC